MKQRSKARKSLEVAIAAVMGAVGAAKAPAQDYSSASSSLDSVHLSNKVLDRFVRVINSKPVRNPKHV